MININMEPITQAFKIYNSPVGKTILVAREGAIIKVEIETKNNFNLDIDTTKSITDQCGINHYGEILQENTEVLLNCQTQLEEYFEGKRKQFDFFYKNIGTPFREKVWEKLEQIPYGQTRTYQDIAISLNNIKAVRAVGGANHHNNLWIIVPCHRVIGKSGKLVGYGGGLHVKEFLLEHEARFR